VPYLASFSQFATCLGRLVRFAAAAGIAGTSGGGEVLKRLLTGLDRNAAEADELALWRLNSALFSTLL
jgi:hypothetical protein